MHVHVMKTWKVVSWPPFSTKRHYGGQVVLGQDIFIFPLAEGEWILCFFTECQFLKERICSGRRTISSDNNRLFAMEPCLMLERIPPLAGFESGPLT